MTQKTNPVFRKYEDALDRRANKAHKIFMQQQKESYLAPRTKNGKIDMSFSEEFDVYDDLEIDYQQR
jgi:hypothetical protein